MKYFELFINILIAFIILGILIILSIYHEVIGLSFLISLWILFSVVLGTVFLQATKNE